MMNEIVRLSNALAAHREGEMIAAEVMKYIGLRNGLFFGLTREEMETVATALGAFDTFQTAARSIPGSESLGIAPQARLAGVCAAYLNMLASGLLGPEANQDALAETIVRSLKTKAIDRETLLNWLQFRIGRKAASNGESHD